MNQELIALAKSKPFEFIGWLPKELIHNSHEPLRYYFWLCELQRWIEEKYSLSIEIQSCVDMKNHNEWINTKIINYKTFVFKITTKQIISEIIDLSNKIITKNKIYHNIYNYDLEIFLEIKNKFSSKELILEETLLQLLKYLVQH